MKERYVGILKAFKDIIAKELFGKNILIRVLFFARDTSELVWERA